MKPKKLTSLIWRTMGEAILFSLILLGVILYVLYIYDLIKPIETLFFGLTMGLTLGFIVSLIGLIFGYWGSYRIKSRLDQLSESMRYLETGTRSNEIPQLGEDEIGKLGEQLQTISHRWEEQVNSLQRLSTNNAELAEKARFTAVIEERQRLARELHDAVSQQLFAISMTATAVRRTMHQDFDKAARQVTLIEEMSSVAQSEMRALLLHLRPVHLEGKRLTDAIQDLMQDLHNRIPIEIQLDLDPHLNLPKGIEDHLFRIVQESLSNTLRHAQATSLGITLYVKDENVRMYIWDNGVGFELDETKKGSYGLMTIEERVNELGGSLTIVTAPGKGTRMQIRVPIIAKDEGNEYVSNE